MNNLDKYITIECRVRRGLARTERTKADGRPREDVYALPLGAESAISAQTTSEYHLTALMALSAQGVNV